MENFLNEVIEGNRFELLIDTKIFSKDIVLKAAYNFLDKGYFFFSLNEDSNIVLQFTIKDEIKEDAKKILGEFSDELLSVYLRDKLEQDNKSIRERIVEAAISNSIDSEGFVSMDTDKKDQEQNQIDFDKDIDEILKEIENDPDLKIDEEEIERILKEIEDETENMEEEKPKITLDPNAFSDVKKKFQNK